MPAIVIFRIFVVSPKVAKANHRDISMRPVKLCGYVLLSPVLLQTNVVNVSEPKLSSVSKASKASVFMAWYHQWFYQQTIPI
jgi:hypothetical protein